MTIFDYLRFCKEKNIEPIVKDAYGLKHDLIKENIQIIFTVSQFKLWKYYDSWDHYKRCFKENDCHACLTNYEENYIKDTTINYQQLQTLQYFPDEDIEAFTQKEFDKLNKIGRDKEEMLKVIGADDESEDPYKRAVNMYPEFLRDSLARYTLKSIKRRMLLDAKSGSIKCENKRLFAIPDMYAFCEFLFLNEKEPTGLLKDGEVAGKLLLKHDKVDVLRSPH